MRIFMLYKTSFSSLKVILSSLKVILLSLKVILSRLKVTFSDDRVTNSNLLVFLRNKSSKLTLIFLMIIFKMNIYTLIVFGKQ